MLQKCKPRNLALVKAKSKRLHQASISTSSSSKDVTVDGSGNKDDSTIVSQSTVTQAMSPLFANNGIIKQDRFAEATSTDSFEFFYRYNFIILFFLKKKKLIN